MLSNFWIDFLTLSRTGDAPTFEFVWISDITVSVNADPIWKKGYWVYDVAFSYEFIFVGFKSQSLWKRCS